MAFGHPSQKHHEVDGIRKALASPKTPAHLRPHLHKRLQEHTMKQPMPTVRNANLFTASRGGKVVNPVLNMDKINSGTSRETEVSKPAASRQNTMAVAAPPKAPLHGQGAPKPNVHHQTERHARKTIHHQTETAPRKTLHNISETAKRKVILGRLETAKRKVVTSMTRPLPPNKSLAHPTAHNGAKDRNTPKTTKSTKALFG